MANSHKKMRAIILAAGLGKRMHSSIAKVLHPVLGRPMIWRILKTLEDMHKRLHKQGINLEHIHIVLGHNAQQVEEYVNQCIEAKDLTCPISFHIQKPQLGTGHAVMTVQDALDKFQGNILILPGDCPLLGHETLCALLENHHEENADLSLLTSVLDNPHGYGRILRTAQGKISGIVEEKDASNKEKQIQEISTSIYCFNWPIIKKGLSGLKNNNKQNEYYLTDLVAWAANDKHKVVGISVADTRRTIGINSQEDLYLANKYLNEIVLHQLMTERGVTIIDPASTWIAPEVIIDQDTVILPGCWLIGDIRIGLSCIIGPHTSIEGKVKIGSQTKIVQSHLEDCQLGNNCQIGPFAHLRKGTALANEIRIGNFVELKMTSIASHSNVSHLSYVGDTTIGKEANIGAGTITANYDHVTKIKAPTIIGDGVAVGSNAVLVAPVNIGKDSVVAAGTVVTKNVGAGELAVGRVKQENIPGWTAKRKEKSKKVKRD